MREIDFCAVCRSFTDVFRYRRHWLCDDCPKSELDNKLDREDEFPLQTVIYTRNSRTATTEAPPKSPPKNPRKPNKPKVPKAPKPPKEKVIRPKREYKKQVPKDRIYKPSCRETVIKFFQAHRGEVFRSYELWEKFPDYLLPNIKNTLSQLVRDGFMYSRKINIGGYVKFGIYSTDASKVMEYQEEENVTQLVEYVNNNYPVTTRKLSEVFSITPEAVQKRLRKVDEIEIFQYMNRNFYFPVQYKMESIDNILENTTWGNQWTS